MLNLPQYPSPPGNRNQYVGTFQGPAAYTQVGVATPPTGGLVVKATDMGLVGIEWADVSVSDDGQYGAKVIYDNGNPNDDVPQVRLLIFVAATGAQVAGGTNLSGRTFRIWAFGL